MQITAITINLILSILCFICIHLETLKNEKNLRENIKKVIIPGIAAGALVSVLATHKITMATMLVCVLFGILTGEVIYILYLVAKRTWEKERINAYYDDGSDPKYYITGDKHRNFKHIKNFCCDMNTRKKDVLIVLGDAGFNYFRDVRDDELKKEAAAMNITLLCLHAEFLLWR